MRMGFRPHLGFGQGHAMKQIVLVLTLVPPVVGRFGQAAMYAQVSRIFVDPILQTRPAPDQCLMGDIHNLNPQLILAGGQQACTRQFLYCRLDIGRPTLSG